MPLWRFKKWPGFGPFSHLPPWERPGWYFRGACWRYLYLKAGPRFRFPSISLKDEISALEEYKKELEEEKMAIEEELREVEKRLEELRKRGME